LIADAFRFVQIHPYLFANLPLLAADILIARRTPYRDYGRAAIFSGLVCMLCAPVEATTGDYWHPLLLGGWRVGIESLIFTFTSGATVWLVSAAPMRKTGTIGVRTLRDSFLRIVLGALPVSFLYVILWRLGVNSLTATLIAPTGLVLFLLYRRSHLWRLSLYGLLFFPLLSLAVINVQFAFWPNYLAYWNPNGTWSTLVFGIPRGELAFAFMFGAYCPVIIASALDMRIQAFRNSTGN
jgi:hypothetical protein